MSPTATDDLNSTQVRTDIPGEVYPEGAMPQLGGGRASLQPGVDVFQLPVNLPALWHDIIVEREGTKYKHVQLKFDKDNPLIVVGGPNNGAAMLMSFTTLPRPRGRKDNPETLWISDLAILLDTGLGDKSRPLTKGGEAGVLALKAAINKYAGRTVRLDHGLSAQCRPDKVRYAFKNEDTDESMEDPRKLKGCGQRHYTKDFKAPDAKQGEPQFDAVIPCKGKYKDGTPCGAALRGFESVERILPPAK